MNAKPEFSGSTAIVPRDSIEHIVACRDQALALYVPKADVARYEAAGWIDLGDCRGATGPTPT